MSREWGARQSIVWNWTQWTDSNRLIIVSNWFDRWEYGNVIIAMFIRHGTLQYFPIYRLWWINIKCHNSISMFNFSFYFVFHSTISTADMYYLWWLCVIYTHFFFNQRVILPFEINILKHFRYRVVGDNALFRTSTLRMICISTVIYYRLVIQNLEM